jgi:hypothetical protein
MLTAVIGGELRDRRGSLAQVPAQRRVDRNRQVLNVAAQGRAGIDRGTAVAGLHGRGDLVALTAERDRLVA